MPEPEANGAEAQANPLQQAMAEARAEMGQPADVAEPEAEAPDGTGDVEDTRPEPSGDSQPEVDWSDPEARERYLNERFISVEEHEKRKRDQLRSLQGELDLAKQAREREQAQQRREALLSELDELAEDDPRAYRERLDRDPEAARAIAERANQIDPTVFANAQVALATTMAKALFNVRPELEALAEEGGDEWAKVVDQSTGGAFGYVQRTAFEEGKNAGVEEFKQSKAFKESIAEAERRGAHEALGEYGLETPASEDASPPSGSRQFDDPLQQAAFEASRELGRKGVNITALGNRRKPAVSR